MEAARLLYGELELDASSALFAVDELDSGFDILAEQILETQDALGETGKATEESSDLFKVLGVNVEDLGKSFGVLALSLAFAYIIYDLVSSTEAFQKVIMALQKAFEPLIKTLGEFAEFIGKYIADALLFAISLLSEFITYLTKTEQGLALLKIAAIFFAVVAGVALVASFKAMAVAAYGAMTAFIAMITPLLPFIAIAALVAAAITTVILVLEDLYYFATGEGESVAGGFFAALGMSPEEIEEVRKSIKEFIDIVKSSWESFTKGVGKLVPQFKKIFSALLAIAKSFFITVFKYVFDLAKIFSGVWDIIKGIFTGNFDLILGGFKKIADGILSIFKSMGNFIADIFNNLIEMIAPLKDIASSIFGGKAPAPIAGARAEGGSVQAGKNYVVGDGGEPEVFTAGANGFITPFSKIDTPSVSGASGGRSGLSVVIQNVSIVVQGGANMADDFKSQFSELLRQACIEAGQELGLEI